MTGSVLVQAKIKPEQKEGAEAIFERAGLSTGDAIRLFFQQTINADDIPFMITAKRPSAKLRKAMKQAASGEGKTYETADDLFAQWDKPRA